jgi:hypothetical protein
VGSGFHFAAAALLAAGLSVEVFVRDGVGIEPAVLAAARTAAAHVFQQADVTIVWLDANSGRSRGPFYTIRLEAGGRGNALGSAAVGTMIARVFHNRIVQVASAAGAGAGVVLGHAIAHELGHLLLRRTGHSASGLMRFQMDVQLASQGRLLFSGDEARFIRARLAEEDRARGATPM